MTAYRDPPLCSTCAAEREYSERVLEGHIAQQELIAEVRRDRDRLRRLADTRLVQLVLSFGLLFAMVVWAFVMLWQAKR